ncbi:transcription factor NIGTH1-like [Salvia miltiorrhiza]|uniref:transcription factor NIGTH1-like n=1 Tax=Salvia miltiorrhiza TaxID=226208 RepID=UPI0025AD86BD|nr:transcription factor NIGTH1-like [Salvia miltiorrhiza]
MASISKTLNLDMDISVPKTISDVLTQVSRIRDSSMKSSEFDFYIHLLEEELRKVDAFKRELPYCMQLLQDAIETLRKERERLRERDEGAVVVTDELIPVEESGDGGGVEPSDHNLSDKKTWMSRVRLWNAPVQFHNGNQTFSLQSRGGAVVALKRGLGKEGKRVEEVSVAVPVEAIDLSDLPNQKKQRRCWSPHLHNLFIDALLRLGGPYVATPKQIREQMKVDGLTNDEVKSHLQKYRLHIKKFSVGITDASTTVAHSGSLARGSGDEDDAHKS